MRITSPTAILFLAVLYCTGDANSQDAIGSVAGYPDGVQSVEYRSAGDDSMQPTLIWYPKSDQPVPLLVSLHTWSSDYRQSGGEAQYAMWCQKAGWAFVHPNFRGVNKTHQALGSDLVVADIVSAVNFVKSQTKIDASRIYCVGVSGGGHASLLMASRAPELWAGVSAWCGISDIKQWHQQCQGTSTDRYARMIESALEGSPQTSERCSIDAWHRSPLKWFGETQQLPPLDINHGINDGRSGSVPFSHSMLAYIAAVSHGDAAAEPFNEQSVSQFYETRQIPEALKSINTDLSDPLYGNHPPLFRVHTDRVRLTLFDGGHEIVHEAALNWLAAQTKGRPVNWKPKRQIEFTSDDDDKQSGK
ncbi:MAG: prolyl oligopeptidase family serine peptidase [Planctomycetales bacterium]|nr:prolyl oligopeptidase family serine peptidase [Planctomycetales bacterium]